MIHVDNLAYIALGLSAAFAVVMVALGALATWLRARREPRYGGYVIPLAPQAPTVKRPVWDWSADPDFEWSDT